LGFSNEVPFLFQKLLATDFAACKAFLEKVKRVVAAMPVHHLPPIMKNIIAMQNAKNRKKITGPIHQ
jgi:hypothetical protein